MTSKQEEDLTAQLQWVQLRKELDSLNVESFKDKAIRKTIENPLVPIGCLVTGGSIAYGLKCLIARDSRKQQLMMRLRVIAQGFTIIVCAISLTAAAKKNAGKGS